MKIQIEQLDLLHPWPQLVLRDGYHALRILVRVGTIPLGQIETRPVRKRVVSHRRLRRRVAGAFADELLKMLAQEGLSAGPAALKWFMPAAWGSFDMANADAGARRKYVEERFLLSTGLASPLRDWVIESQQRPASWPMPAVTVALCTRDREPILEDAIRTLQQLDYPNFNILVVNNSSDPVPTAEIADRMGVSCVRCGVAGLSRARNVALACASADWVAFIDDDCRPEKNWLKELVRPTQDEKCRAVIGQVLPARLETPAEIVMDLRERTEDGSPGAAMLIHRPLLHSIGGFDIDLGPGKRSLGGGEEVDALHRIRRNGYVVENAPRALAHHHRILRARSLRHKLHGRAMGHAAFHARRGSFIRRIGTLIGDLRGSLTGQSRYAFSLVLLEMKATLVGPLRYAWAKASRAWRPAVFAKPQAVVAASATSATTDPSAPIKSKIAA